MLHMCHCRRRWWASAGSGLTVTRTLLPVSHSDSSAGLKMKPWCPRRHCVASTVPPLRHRGLEGRNLCSLFGHSFFFLYWGKSSSCVTALIMVFIPVVSLASKTWWQHLCFGGAQLSLMFRVILFYPLNCNFTLLIQQNTTVDSK